MSAQTCQCICHAVVQSYHRDCPCGEGKVASEGHKPVNFGPGTPTEIIEELRGNTPKDTTSPEKPEHCDDCGQELKYTVGCNKCGWYRYVSAPTSETEQGHYHTWKKGEDGIFSCPTCGELHPLDKGVGEQSDSKAQQRQNAPGVSVSIIGEDDPYTLGMVCEDFSHCIPAYEECCIDARNHLRAEQRNRLKQAVTSGIIAPNGEANGSAATPSEPSIEPVTIPTFIQYDTPESEQQMASLIAQIAVKLNQVIERLSNE